MGKKHEQGENGWAASKVGRKKKKKEKVGRWREEEIRVLGRGIRVLRRKEDRRRETLSTHSTHSTNVIIPKLNQSLKG
jgi:hypothetical protein